MTKIEHNIRRLSKILVAIVAIAAMFLISPPLNANAETNPDDITWNFNPAENTSLASYQEGSDEDSGEITDATGKYSMSVDASATGAKFSPRTDNGDTQVNAGTVLSFDVAASSDGATVTVNLSGGNTTFNVQIGDDVATKTTENNTASFDVPAEGGTVSITFSEPAYLSSIVVAFNTSFPESDPTDVTAADTTWSSSSTSADDIDIEGETGEWDGIMIDASSGKSSKFVKNSSNGYMQINTPVTLYVPLAASDQSATLSLSFHKQDIDNVQITVDDELLTGVIGDDGAVYTTTLDASNAARWVEVDINAVDETSSVTIYLGSIELDYASDTDSDTDTDESEDYPGIPSNVTAEDTVWDLTTDNTALDAEGTKDEWKGILIDASASGAKFSSNGGDDRVQVKSGTVIYIPVAASDEDAILRLSGTAAAGMTVTIDGTDSDVNTDVIVDTSDGPRYVTVEFGSTGEAGSNAAIYLTSISMDYLEDDEQTYHVVTVGDNENGDGESYDYQTITDALNKETSSLKDRLVLSIAPGDYEEQIHVTQPGVVFQNASYTNDDGTYTYTGEVIIHESKYSSNTWNEDGEYVPNDENDLGTSDCGTVIIDQTATGFSAYGITFQNDYNVVDNTKSGTQTPAVAFDSKADKVNLSDCKFIGRQDTLYVEGSGNRVYVSDSYIEGSVDFIFGDADAYFTDCNIHMAKFADRESGYYTAPNTKEGHVGLVFYNCTLTADDQYTNASLGRPWQTLCSYDTESIDDEGHSQYSNINCAVKNNEYSNVSSAATFIGSTMPSEDQLIPSRWSLWTHRNEKDVTVNVTYVKDVRFTEISTYNPDGTPVEEDQVGDFEVANDPNSPYAGSKFVKIDSETNPETAATDMLDKMCIGSSFGWDPANMTINSDEGPGSDPDEDPDDGDGTGDTGDSGSGTEIGGNTTDSGTDGGDTTDSGTGTDTGDTTDSDDTGNTSGNSGSGSESGSASGSGSSSSTGGTGDTVTDDSAGSGSSASGSSNSGSGDETGGSSGSSTSANADGSNDSSTSDNGTSDADDSDSDGLSSLSQTGSAVAGVAVAAVILVAAGVIAMVARRRTATGRHSHAR